MQTYEFNGEKYKKASKHQKEWGNRLISELQLKGDESILDLGCGDGVLTQQLAALVEEGYVLGIDASAGMIQTAKKYGRDNLDFIQLDINDLDYTNKFDIIFSNAALHWVKDHAMLLQRSYTALKPGGRILWNFAGDGNCSNFYAVVRNKMKEPDYAAYFEEFVWPWYMPSKKAYQELAQQRGFSRIEIAEENADRYFSDADEMIQWLDQPSLVPFIQCIPPEKQAAFRGEIIEEMLERTLQPNGTCFETFRRIKVNAIK